MADIDRVSQRGRKGGRNRSASASPVPFADPVGAEQPEAPADALKRFVEPAAADAPAIGAMTASIGQATAAVETETQIVADAATEVAVDAPAIAASVVQPLADIAAPGAAATADAVPPMPISTEFASTETPAPLRAPDVMKGLFQMATFAPVSPQAMFGDMNDRAKGMFEKSSKMGEDMVDFAKGNVEALVTSARVAAKGSETLAQDAAEYGKKSFESATTAFKSFAAVKSPTELFQLQSDFAKTSFDSAVAEASKLSEGMLKLMGDMFQPLSSRYAVASEKFKAPTV